MEFLYGAEAENSITWLAETLVGINFGACEDDANKRLAAIRNAKNIFSEYEFQSAALRIFHESAVVFTLQTALKEFIQHQDEKIVADVLDVIHYCLDIGREERQYLVDKGIVQIAFSHLQHANPEVKSAALLVLHSFINPDVISNVERQSLIDEGVMKTAFSHLDHGDANVKRCALCIVAAFIIESTEAERHLLIGDGIIKSAIACLAHVDPKVKIAALALLHIFVSGPHECLQYTLECDVMRLICECLMHPHIDVHELALELMPYFFAPDDNDFEPCDLLDDSLIQAFIHLLDNDVTQAKALTFLLYIPTFGTAEQITSMINLNAIPAVCKCLDFNQKCIALTFLKRTLEKCGNQVNEICRMIEECGGLDQIKKHQNDTDKHVVALADELVENFLSAKLNQAASIN